MMKTLLAITIVAITTISNAETLSFPSFRIEVADNWAHNVETGAQANDDLGQLINIYHPDGSGVLKIQSRSTPVFVSPEILRNMTNVDSSMTLDWRNWGDYSGYQFDYLERGSFYRQWWLAHGRTVIFIVYDSHTEIDDTEIDEINRIVNSITANMP